MNTRDKLLIAFIEKWLLLRTNQPKQLRSMLLAEAGLELDEENGELVVLVELKDVSPFGIKINASEALTAKSFRRSLSGFKRVQGSLYEATMSKGGFAVCLRQARSNIGLKPSECDLETLYAALTDIPVEKKQRQLA